MAAATTRDRTNHATPAPPDEGVPHDPEPVSIGDVNAPLVPAPPALPPLLTLYPPPAHIESTVTLEVPPYDGWSFQIWKNHPLSVSGGLESGSTDLWRKSWLSIFLRHDEDYAAGHWVSDEGQPLPQWQPETGTTVEDETAALNVFMAGASAELMNLMKDAMYLEARRVPNFQTEKRRS
jgi:hypothetical protein